MSVRLMGEVWGLDVDHARLLILLALADHADDKGRNIYPSLNLVAWKTGYSKRQVRSVVRGLREEGALIVVKRASWHRPTHYRLDLGKLPQKAPLEREELSSSLENSGGKSEALRGETASSREEMFSNRAEVATSAKPSVNPSTKSSKNPAIGLLKNESEHKREDARRELSDYRNLMGKSGLYNQDELIALKPKSLEELRVIHSQKLSHQAGRPRPTAQTERSTNIPPVGEAEKSSQGAAGVV